MMNATKIKKPHGRPQTCESTPEMELKRDRAKAAYYNLPERESWARTAVYLAKQKAKRYGTTSSLTKADVLAIAADHCPISGVELSYETGLGHRMAHTASIMRIDDRLPYQAGNIQLMAASISAGIGQLSVRMLIRIGHHIASKLLDYHG